MNLTNLLELSASQALGALSKEESAQLASSLVSHPGTGEDLAAFHEVAALIAAAKCRPVAPPPDLRARILEQAARSASAPDAMQPPDLTVPDSVPGFRFVLGGDPGWISTSRPGFRVKPLAVSADMGYEVAMLEFAPGTRFPAHRHASSEEVFVFSGTLQTEGRTLGPGDFLHSEPGTWHQELVSPDGCRALLIRRAKSMN